MDDDQSTENIDEEPGPAYAALNLRARAFLIDTAILGGSLIAFVCYIRKGILGIPSFLAMAFTRRHQAVHDLLTGTTVQLRDPSLARSYDFVLERKGTREP